MKQKMAAWIVSLTLVFSMAAPAAALDGAAAAQWPVDSGLAELIVELSGDPLLPGGGTDEDREDLEARQDALFDQIAALDEAGQVELLERYTTVFNGIAVLAPYRLVEKIEGLEGVVCVDIASQFETAEEPPGEQGARPSVTAGKMSDLAGAHSRGLDGTGTVIAVIDTGLDADHPAFSAEGMDAESASLTLDLIEARLSRLNAGRRSRGLRAQDVYYSAKVPFMFDYTRNSPDVSHSPGGAGDHGTAVASLAAGVETEECSAGTAPGAQILAMKVFSDRSGTASERVILAAIEDAVALGADVINLSLGIVSGFSYGLTGYSSAIENTAASGVAVCAAAGNEYSSAYGSNSGRDLGAAGNVDTGVISEPSTLDGVLSVGSVNSAQYYADGFLAELGGGKKQIFSVNDTGGVYGLRDFTDLLKVEGHENGDYEYAVVPGVGTEDDYAQVDVKGRLALVMRGEINFTEKSDNAFERGALGVIVYNNVAESINMDMTGVSPGNDLPCVIVSRKDGEALVSAAGPDGIGKLTVLSGTRLVEAPDGWQPSEPSSWGPLSDLTLKPDVVGVGGNVYTAADGGTYSTGSGTSFASPQAAGSMALLLQYLREEHGLTGSDACRRARTLLMNTAQPLTQEDGVEYSPRKQGAGLLGAGRACETPVYVTVNGNMLPKAELGDDSGQTGTYSFSLTVSNTAETDVCYILRASVLTEVEDGGYMLQKARPAACETAFSGSGVRALCETDGGGELLLRDVTGDGKITLMDRLLLKRAVSRMEDGLSGESTVTVPGGGSTEVRVTLRLAGQEMRELQESFENGTYVEGYVYLEAMDAISPELSVPMLAFFGDWSKAPLFCRTSQAELDSAQAEGKALGNSPEAMCIYTGPGCYLGENPVAQDEEYIPERSNAMGCDGEDGSYISGIVLDLYRNARTVKLQAVSQGRVLYEVRDEDVVKSCISTVDNNMHSSIANFRFEPRKFGLGDGSGFSIRITGTKDAEGPYAVETVEIPVYVDGTAPVIEGLTVDRGEDGRTHLSVTVRDNFYTAGLALFSADGRNELATWAVDQKDRGEAVTLELDVTDLLPKSGGNLILGVIDYARNRTFQDVIFG